MRRRRYDPANVLADDGTVTHKLYHHYDRPNPRGAMDDVEALMHDQAQQLGRRPTGPVDWARGEPLSDRVACKVARLPTEPGRG